MCGTDIAYGAMRCAVLTLRVQPCDVRGSGTDIPYGAMRRPVHSVLSNAASSTNTTYGAMRCAFVFDIANGAGKVVLGHDGERAVIALHAKTMEGVKGLESPESGGDVVGTRVVELKIPHLK
eukprot:3941947-Rhodomonas_salina.5